MRLIPLFLTALLLFSFSSANSTSYVIRPVYLHPPADEDIYYDDDYADMDEDEREEARDRYYEQMDEYWSRGRF